LKATTSLASAELSMIASRTFGIPFSLDALNQVCDALIEAYYRDGSTQAAASRLMQNLKLDDETSRDLLLRRFRMQAQRAAQQTAYYGELFARIGLDPSQLTREEIEQIPLTPKEAIRDHPYDFVCRDSKPIFRSTTTGTTGRPTSICFSAYEIQSYVLLGAIGDLIIGDVTPEDIFMIASVSRATLGNYCGAGAYARAGAIVFQGGIVDPGLSLEMLTEEHRFPGKRPRVSLMVIYPSYLGELVETGLRMGYKPSDFGLRRIDIGGEIATKGLQERTHKLFGPVPYFHGYGMTETWGMGADVCEQGHLHFGTSGYVEFINPETGAPAKPGEIATVVATPLPPSRETTLLIRYNTEDVVRMLDEPPTCKASGTTGTSLILGKLRLSIRHDDGWTFPRDVLEALEAVEVEEVVPLPARCGFWAVEGGVAVEVVTRSHNARARQIVGDALEAHGVPLRQLYLHEDPGQLQQPYPLRADLHEVSFRASGGRQIMQA
jgi:phenylacetate-CoA ligase